MIIYSRKFIKIDNRKPIKKEKIMNKQIIVPLIGRLGNQMFEYAFAKSLELEYGYDIFFDESPLDALHIENRLKGFVGCDEFKRIDKYNKTFLQKIGLRFFDKIADKEHLDKKFKHEKKFQTLYSCLGLYLCHDGYIPFPKRTMGKRIICEGYFQSEKYFSKYKKEIIRDFTFKDEYIKGAREYLDTINQEVDTVCMHIRLGDYVSHPLHGVADIQYYLKAINYIRNLKPNSKIIVFSDNIDLVKQKLDNIENCVYIPSTLTDHETMFLASKCKDFIISNSSFSWWIQYLSGNKDKIVIAPSRWYAKPCPSELFMNNWYLIEV